MGILLIGGIITALVLGFIVAFLSVKGIYIIGVFEVVVALALGYALKHLMKISNYDIFDHLHYLFIGLIVVTYVSNQYFQYLIILDDAGFQTVNFWDFMKARFEAGLTLNSIDTGWIGLVISWALQLIISYFIGLLRLNTSLTSYLIKRVDPEVFNFAYYHFVKNKTEDQVRLELSNKGWTKTSDQDQVFEAIASIGMASEINRID